MGTVYSLNKRQPWLCVQGPNHIPSRLAPPPHAAHTAVTPYSIFSTSVRHKLAKTAGRKQLIPQCSAGLRSELHNLSQTVELIHSTLYERTVDFGPRLWTCKVSTAGCGTSQQISALRLSPIRSCSPSRVVQQLLAQSGLPGYIHLRKFLQSDPKH